MLCIRSKKLVVEIDFSFKTGNDSKDTKNIKGAVLEKNDMMKDLLKCLSLLPTRRNQFVTT